MAQAATEDTRSEKSGQHARGQDDKPLCVDLDRTLVVTDTLVETFLRALRRDPFVMLRLPLWLRRGRATLKQNLALHTPLDAAALPYNDALLALLKAEKRTGRRIVLVTAADATIARSVAEHVGLFDDVMASDGRVNLKGKTKASALVARFGKKGFAYAGDSTADFAVWDHADGIIVVNASAKVISDARQRYGTVTVIEGRRRSR